MLGYVKATGTPKNGRDELTYARRPRRFTVEPACNTIPARLPRPNNPHGTHYNLARQQQRVSAAGQRGPPPPKAQSCPS